MSFMAVIVFDLDGTVSDPAQGITASINYALEKVGALPVNPDCLQRYIGPPLNQIFSEVIAIEKFQYIEKDKIHLLGLGPC